MKLKLEELRGHKVAPVIPFYILNNLFSIFQQLYTKRQIISLNQNPHLLFSTILESYIKYLSFPVTPFNPNADYEHVFHMFRFIKPMVRDDLPESVILI